MFSINTFKIIVKAIEFTYSQKLLLYGNFFNSYKLSPNDDIDEQFVLRINKLIKTCLDQKPCSDPQIKVEIKSRIDCYNKVLKQFEELNEDLNKKLKPLFEKDLDLICDYFKKTILTDHHNELQILFKKDISDLKLSNEKFKDDLKEDIESFNEDVTYNLLLQKESVNKQLAIYKLENEIHEEREKQLTDTTCKFESEIKDYKIIQILQDINELKFSHKQLRENLGEQKEFNKQLRENLREQKEFNKQLIQSLREQKEEFNKQLIQSLREEREEFNKQLIQSLID